MGSEWKNQVLSLIETAPDSFILTSRKLYSVDMGCFLLIWNWNEIGMTKWPSNEWNDPMKKRIFRWNDGMRPNSRDFRIKGFAFVQKSPFIWPHSVIPKWLEWSGNDQNDCWMISTHCNFHSLLFKNDMEWRNEVEWGGFRRRRKNEFWDVCHSSIIPSSFRNSNTNLALDCPWNDLNDTGMTEMSREWQNDNGMMGGLMLSRGFQN